MTGMVVARADYSHAITALQEFLAKVFEAAMPGVYFHQPLHLGVRIVPIAGFMRMRDDEHIIRVVHFPQTFIELIRMRSLAKLHEAAFVLLEENVMMASSVVGLGPF